MDGADQRQVFESGRVVGGYRVLRLLGKGGMAEVYEVESERTGSPYALKVFVCDQANAVFLKRRFLAEGRLLAKLHHPRIVRVYDFGLEGDEERPYFVMDLVLDGQGRPCTLRDALAYGEVDEDRIAGWYGDLAEALAYIHGKGVVHRDVSLENVMVGPDGRAVLSDFGVSKIVDRDLRAELSLSLVTQTTNGRPLMGKAFYLAPEVRAGGAETFASDFYALGVLLFYLLNQVWYTPGARTADLLATFDDQWQDILAPLLAEDPAKRVCRPWTDPRLRQLDELQARQSRQENPSRWRGWRRVSVLAAAVVLLLVGVATLLRRPPGPSRTTSPDGRSPLRIKAEKDANVCCTLPASVRGDETCSIVRLLMVGTMADLIERDALGFGGDAGEEIDQIAQRYADLDGEEVRSAIQMLGCQAAFRLYLCPGQGRKPNYERAADVLNDINEENEDWANDLLKGLDSLLPVPADKEAFMRVWRRRERQ